MVFVPVFFFFFFFGLFFYSMENIRMCIHTMRTELAKYTSLVPSVMRTIDHLEGMPLYVFIERERGYMDGPGIFFGS